MKLWVKIFIGLIAGVLLGLCLGEKAIVFKPLGDIFLNLLSMMVSPLVFCSILSGIASISDMKKLGRIGVKSLSMYLGTTAVAISIGLVFAFMFKTGSKYQLPLESAQAVLHTKAGTAGFSFEMITNMFPSNPFRAFLEGNILQIIVCAVFVGIAIRLSGEKGVLVLKFVDSITEIIVNFIGMIMHLAPYGIGASIAWISGSHGTSILVQLGKFIIFYYLACFVHAFIVYGGIVRLGAKGSFRDFLVSMMDAISCAASTASSSATLPVTMRCVTNNLKVSSEISGFILPLGATVNMNGTAIFQGMAAVFIAQIYNCPLSFFELLIIVITATFSAVGSAGVPGAGMVTLGSVLASVGLPIQGLAVLAGIDRLRDIIGTPMNVLGDAVVAFYVSHKEANRDERMVRSGMIKAEGELNGI